MCRCVGLNEIIDFTGLSYVNIPNRKYCFSITMLNYSKTCVFYDFAKYSVIVIFLVKMKL